MATRNSRSARAPGCWVTLLDRYLEFVESRARHNTVLATASDLKVFFTVVDKPPVDVTPADVSRLHHRAAKAPGRRTGRAAGRR